MQFVRVFRARLCKSIGVKTGFDRGNRMRVVVLGAGIIGVTTAYYLARLGAEVEVLDRQRGPTDL